MNTKEFRKALDAAKVVYAWVMIWPEDGTYIQVTKQSVREAIRGIRDGEVQALVRDNEPDALYIN